ncbi:MAG: hypothetical protein IPM24_19090 [Bryobacterales bacterium]|nr:hypothetical protein [Bryobacterales bacterium]
MTEWLLLLALLPERFLACGLEQARADNRAAAQACLEAGLRIAPHDPRFLRELAGLAFLREDPAEAKRLLHRAARLDPADSYTQDFLGTLYFLDGNTLAALKFWNRAGKPRVDSVSLPASAPLSVRRVLAFPPGQSLHRDDYATAAARLAALDVYAAERLTLAASAGEGFSLRLAAVERPAWALPVGLASGLPYRTLYAHHGPASAFYRWRPHLRRGWASWTVPWGASPGRFWHASFDHRDETWNQGAGDFPFRFWQSAIEMATVASGRLTWTLGAHAARRTAGGFSLLEHTSLRTRLLHLPERGLRLDWTARGEAGRLFGSGAMGGVESGLALVRRQPRSAASLHLRTGRRFGPIPLDRLYLLGMDRDHDLRLRAVPGLADGRKGQAPAGRAFALVNAGFERTVLRAGLTRISLGPFFDTGYTDRWYAATGLAAGVEPLPGVRINLSYGWDLRTRRPAFFAEQPFPGGPAPFRR